MAEEQTQPVEQTQEQPVKHNKRRKMFHMKHQQATTTEPSPRPEYIPEKFWDTLKAKLIWKNLVSHIPILKSM